VAVENTKVERLIYTLLTSDAGAGGINTLLNGRIYAYTAPQKATYPVCIYEFRSGSDVQGIGTNRTLARVRYAVRVISKGAPGDREVEAADRIDEVLGHVLNQVLDGYAFNSWRESQITLAEVEPITTQLYRHMGGIFIFEASPV
jgi:hypothetical protein